MSKSQPTSPAPATASNETRTCRTCRTPQPLSAYYQSRRRADALVAPRSECKGCILARGTRCRKIRRHSDLPHPIDPRETRLDLGLAIAQATCRPGQNRTLAEIAAYAGVSEHAIRLIETEALRKVKERLREFMLQADIAESEVRA